MAETSPAVLVVLGVLAGLGAAALIGGGGLTILWRAARARTARRAAAEALTAQAPPAAAGEARAPVVPLADLTARLRARGDELSVLAASRLEG